MFDPLQQNFWGLFALLTAFYVDDIASTVIVAVNKVGSLINGAILGVFMLGLFTKTTTGSGARLGFVAGLLINAALWKWAPGVSWLWWNVIGLGVTTLVGIASSARLDERNIEEGLVWSKALYREAGFSSAWLRGYLGLAVWTVFLFAVLLVFGTR